jgi:hypothetical protein
VPSSALRRCRHGECGEPTIEERGRPHGSPDRAAVPHQRAVRQPRRDLSAPVAPGAGEGRGVAGCDVRHAGQRGGRGRRAGGHRRRRPASVGHQAGPRRGGPVPLPAVPVHRLARACRSPHRGRRRRPRRDHRGLDAGAAELPRAEPAPTGLAECLPGRVRDPVDGHLADRRGQAVAGRPRPADRGPPADARAQPGGDGPQCRHRAGRGRALVAGGARRHGGGIAAAHAREHAVLLPGVRATGAAPQRLAAPGAGDAPAGHGRAQGRQPGRGRRRRDAAARHEHGRRARRGAGRRVGRDHRRPRRDARRAWCASRCRRARCWCG